MRTPLNLGRSLLRRLYMGIMLEAQVDFQASSKQAQVSHPVVLEGDLGSIACNCMVFMILLLTIGSNAAAQPDLRPVVHSCRNRRGGSTFGGLCSGWGRAWVWRLSRP